MTRNAINVANMGAAGPYSHAVDCGELVFLSGQTPVDHATGKLAEGGVATQTQQCFANLFQVLQAGGFSTDDVQKVNVYLTDMNDFTDMNEVYKQQFNAPYPARTTIGVAALPMGAKIEIEMIVKHKQL